MEPSGGEWMGDWDTWGSGAYHTTIKSYSAIEAYTTIKTYTTIQTYTAIQTCTTSKIYDDLPTYKTFHCRSKTLQLLYLRLQGIPTDQHVQPDWYTCTEEVLCLQTVQHSEIFMSYERSSGFVESHHSVDDNIYATPGALPLGSPEYIWVDAALWSPVMFKHD